MPLAVLLRHVYRTLRQVQTSRKKNGNHSPAYGAKKPACSRRLTKRTRTRAMLPGEAVSARWTGVVTDHRQSQVMGNDRSYACIEQLTRRPCDACDVCASPSPVCAANVQGRPDRCPSPKTLNNC
jgi:hypothetical protein